MWTDKSVQVETHIDTSCCAMCGHAFIQMIQGSGVPDACKEKLQIVLSSHLSGVILLGEHVL